MKYLSVCSGIEAATVAWHPLGWEPVAFSEIEPFPSAVLAHHYPDVPNLGDMTKYKEWPDYGIDALVGGTPCQSFSVAGLRRGLEDPRGNLMLTYGAIAEKLHPRWIVWENVPGVMSSNKGRDFGSFLGMLELIGYGIAYRILDAQYFGVAQRRRRVFVVGYLGDWRRAAQVLLEPESLRWNPPPRREAGEDASRVAGTLAANGGGTTRPAGNCNELDFCIAHTLRASGFDASEDGTGRGTPLVAHTLNAKGGSGRSDGESETLLPVVAGTMKACKDSGGWSNSADHAAAGYMIPVLALNARQDPDREEELSPPMSRKDTGHAVAFALRGRDGGAMPEIEGDKTGALRASAGGSSRSYVAASAVRRLTPRECERLQGFPDDYTLIPWRGKDAPDGPRYKALGNSMAVPVMAWIGKRIQEVELART